jgi:hypothetical protein
LQKDFPVLFRVCTKPCTIRGITTVIHLLHESDLALEIMNEAITTSKDKITRYLCIVINHVQEYCRKGNSINKSEATLTEYISLINSLQKSHLPGVACTVFSVTE